MKLNHFICPNCGHDFYSEYAYATCDACRTFFYLSASKTCQLSNDNTIPLMQNADEYPYVKKIMMMKGTLTL